MFDLVLSVVVIVRNQERRVAERIEALAETIRDLAPEHEIVVVDNASSDATVSVLEALSHRLANLQVYCLSNLVSRDGAAAAGLEQSIGDLVVVVESLDWDFSAIPKMVDRAFENYDIVFATSERPGAATGSMRYRILSNLFVRLYRRLTGIDLRAEVPRFRLFNRRVASFIMQHGAPDLVYQVVPRMAGFRRSYVECATPALVDHDAPGLLSGIERAIALTVATSVLPIRIISLTCLSAAVLSVVYSLYVVVIYLTKEDVAPGWTTISLQLSVIFFLLSMSLGVLSEYIVYITNLTAKPPRYHIAREFRSDVISRKKRLNVLLDEVAGIRGDVRDAPAAE